MGAFKGEYPRDLAKVIGHAKRLRKVLAQIESKDADVWFRGRASELRGVVSLAVADWRAGASDAAAASQAILSYVDTLHRGVASKLRRALALDCCDLDEVITERDPEEWPDRAAADTATEAAPPTNGPTQPARWVDSPTVLARVHEGLPLVDRSARAIARRVGEVHATLDDLRAFGREGLLDAARAFDESRGVPFERWALLRIRNAMIDGVRRWGPLPPGARRRHQDGDAIAPAPSSASAHSPPGDPAAHDGSDSARLPPPTGPHDLPLGLGQASGGLGATPEALLERAQIAALVRDIVADLPDRERVMIEQTYFQDLTPEQAGASIGVGRSWAHRMHARAIERVERELRKRDGTTVGGASPWPSKRS